MMNFTNSVASPHGRIADGGGKSLTTDETDGTDGGKPAKKWGRRLNHVLTKTEHNRTQWHTF
jgi:hypothetical protein